MIDLRAAARLAWWLLRRHWLSSAIGLLVCAILAGKLAKVIGFGGVTLATFALTAGFVIWRSRGWYRWSRRLPIDPYSVFMAQLIWWSALALPALLTASWSTVDHGSGWTGWARSLAWLIGLAAVLLAGGDAEDRIMRAAGLTMWLISTEVLTASQTGAVVHDLALAAVTLGYVLAGIAPGRRDEGGGALLLGLGSLVVFIRERPAALLVSYVGMAIVAVWAFARLRAWRLRGVPFLAAGVAILVGVVAFAAFIVWWLWNGILAVIAWLGELEMVSAVGREMVTSGWLTSALIVGWMAVLANCELRRSRAVGRWMRRRALLLRMPLTRGQVAERVLVPQLKIAAAHGLLVLAIGWLGGWAYRALELEGGDLAQQRSATILVAGLVYLLVAQVFVFRRGFGRRPQIAAAALAAIVLGMAVSRLQWPFVLTLGPLGVIGAWAALSRRSNRLPTVSVVGPGRGFGG